MIESRTMDPEGIKILARSFYRELREGGCTPKQILVASNELLELLAKDMREKSRETASS
jgi:hypothetical protein